MNIDEMINEDELWIARTGLNADSLCGAIETIIFMSDKPVAIQKIKSLIDEEMPLKVLHNAIERLQNEYEQKHHGLRLLEIAEGYQFRTKATYAKYVQDIFKINSLVLSPSALEVLAIIAYKQPVSKVEVDKIRGVDSGHIVRGLMDKRLVKVSGRSEEVGKPVIYSTTSEFLEVFNLKDIGSLPPEHELEELSRATGVGKIADIKTIVHHGDKAKFKFDELAELDELSEKIKNISPETDFTNSIKLEEKKRNTPVTDEAASANTAPVKSAFDLLEEFILKRQIIDQNKLAAQSVLMSSFVDPQIIGDFFAGPFNQPVFEQEVFEMIDLNTGLPVNEALKDDTFLSDDELDLLISKNQEIEELTDSLMKSGQELDIDLGFLKPEESNS